MRTALKITAIAFTVVALIIGGALVGYLTQSSPLSPATIIKALASGAHARQAREKAEYETEKKKLQQAVEKARRIADAALRNRRSEARKNRKIVEFADQEVMRALGRAREAEQELVIAARRYAISRAPVDADVVIAALDKTGG